jgi:hypothetical protein
VGLAGQKDLHDRLINDGLATLYGQFLAAAAAAVTPACPPAAKDLLEGKAYAALARHAESVAADLIVVGRFGHHHTDGAAIGSHADALVRRAGTNVLVAAGGSAAAERARSDEAPAAAAPPTPDAPKKIAWSPAARRRLQRVPFFVRPMARRVVERSVRAAGRYEVSEADFQAVAERMGMGRQRGRAGPE